LGILETLLKIIYLVNCIFLVIVVLLQSGKGGGLAGAFGGGGAADSAFGAQVGSPLRKVTTAMATIFLSLAIVLAVIASTRTGTVGGEESIVPDNPPAQEQPAEQQPGDSSMAPDSYGLKGAPSA